MILITTDNGSRLSNRGPLLEYSPNLSAMYGWQFQETAANIAFLPLHQQIEKLNEAITKTRVARKAAASNGRQDAYNDLTKNIAALLLLRDLLQIGWKILLTGPKIQLYQDESEDSVVKAKEQIRDSLNFERRESLFAPAVKDFVRFMERTRIVDDKPRSVLSLIADGKRLAPILKAAAALNSEERAARLQRSIKPYLQLVESEGRDEYTSHRLIDIWRYFRLTWSTPYRSTPGRNLFYLVRDAGQSCHPVIGIAALGNCVIGLKSRDDAIGWTPDALELQLRKAQREGLACLHDTAHEIVALLRKHLENGIASIDLEGITTINAIANPTIESIEAIETIASEAAEERYALLREEAKTAAVPDLTLVSTDGKLPPVQVREERDSSQALFLRKRAAKLAGLLRAKLLITQIYAFERPEEGLPALLWTDKAWTVKSEKGRSALRTILNANKETKIGASMMEIIVCGAIPPYNHLLGGKLVAMLLCSPEVVRDYEARYGQTTSTIASKMAGCEITRPAQIVYLGTSSLYAAANDKQRLKKSENTNANAGTAEPSQEDTNRSKRPSSASQYNRIKIPGEIVNRPGEIRYECIGLTEGYGSVHYSADTREALDELDRILYQAKRVNSIFGEGTSPRLRKIRQGISLLGLDDRFLIHGQSRLVYAIKLAHNTERYLNGIDEQPRYILPRNRPEKVSKEIARYWIRRWLSSRLNHSPAVAAVAAFTPRDGAVSREYHTGEAEPAALLDL